MSEENFTALGLSEPLVRAMAAAGLSRPTPIQAAAIPHVLDDHDLLGIAQTGTGKTIAFAAPIVQALIDLPHHAGSRAPHALVLAPTRELAIQIEATFEKIAKPFRLHHTVIFGGVGHSPQIKAIARGVDILVATPGRLLDLMKDRHVRLDKVRHFVLDEADRMLDMGFVRDVTKIVAALPADRQSIFLSATMPKAVETLAADILFEPQRVEVTPEVVTVERIAQKVLAVPTAEKRAVLVDLLEDAAMKRVIVFTRTKHGADRLCKQLTAEGFDVAALHGNKSQGARQKALEGFAQGSLRLLVATDIAARGIDVKDISHVVNFDIPVEPESYVHRIGRTARAGREGIAISLCDIGERDALRAIERLTKLALMPAEFAARPGEGRARPGSSAPSGGRPSGEGKHRGGGAHRGDGRTPSPHGKRPHPASGREAEALPAGDHRPEGAQKPHRPAGRRRFNRNPAAA